jgi:hypothetical protein
MKLVVEVHMSEENSSRNAYEKESSEWPDGKVVVSNTRAKVTKYHTKRCRRFPSSPMFLRLETIKAWRENYEDEEWEECAVCAGENEPTSKEDWSEYSLGRKNTGHNIDD